MDILNPGSSEDGLKTLSDLYNLIGGGGSKQTTSGGTTTQTTGGSVTDGGTATWQDAYTDSSSETVHSSISAEGLNNMLKNILEGTQGLAAVSAGQRGAGGYAASTNTLLLNDLMARAAGQVAQNDKTVTTNTVRNVSARSGGSVSHSETTPHTVTTTREPTETTATKGAGGAMLGKAMLGLSLYDRLKKAGIGTKDLLDETKHNGGGDLGPGMSDQAARNEAFDAGQTATEASFGSEFIEGGSLGPGANISTPESYITEDSTLILPELPDLTIEDPTLDLNIPDLVVPDVPDTPDVPEIPEFDFDFADGGSVAKRVNNQIGYQSNKILDMRAGAAGTGATSVNPDVVEAALGTNSPTNSPISSAARQQPASSNRPQSPGTRTVGTPDQAALTNLDAEDIDGLTISNYNATSGGPQRSTGSPVNPDRANPEGGLNSEGKNPDANKVVNTGMNILGSLMPGMGAVQAGSNFVHNPSLETGASLLNKWLKIPGLNVAVKLANNIVNEAEKQESPSHANDVRKFDLAMAKDDGKDDGKGEDKSKASVVDDKKTEDVPTTTTTTSTPTVEDVPEENPDLDIETILANLPTTDEVEYDENGNPIIAGTGIAVGNSNLPVPTGGIINNSAGGDSGDGSGSSGSTTYAADGGHILGKVTGPGTEISDSVDAKLSKNEYVLPADVVEAIGLDKLDALVGKYHTPASIQKLRGGK